jgi:hypothetical protein
MKLKEALINNGSAEDEAEALRIIRQMKVEVQALLGTGSLSDVEDILYQYGLEPDYVMEIMP